jgi:TatD DNase family protein
MLIDTHCHLDFPDFADDRDGLIDRAQKAGVRQIVTICTRVGKFDQIRAVAEAYSDVWCSVGTHPNNATDEPDVPLDAILEAANHPKCVAIGEAGLDYHYDYATPETQEKVFRRHIEAARITQLPLVIHARSADDDMAAILTDETGKGAFPFILHCFSSGAALAQTGVKLGGYISFSGILTFPKSEELREIAKSVPRDRLLVETDAPYLAPKPYRGKRNEPSYVRHTAQVLAETIGVSEAEIETITTDNAWALFAKMGRPDAR